MAEMAKISMLSLIAVVVIVMAAVAAADVTLVRHIIKHTEIPDKRLWSDDGGSDNPWRIYDLNGNYATFLSDTGSFASTGQWSCGLEKLQIRQGGGKFAALRDRGTTIIDYYSDVTKDSIDKDELKKTMAGCIAKYQEKMGFTTNPKSFVIKVNSVDVGLNTVKDSCLNIQSSACAISVYNNACDSDAQCGGGIIKCKNKVCSSSYMISITLALVVALAAVFVF